MRGGPGTGKGTSKHPGLKMLHPDFNLKLRAVATLSDAEVLRVRGITGENRPLQCAGLNRHEAEEEESSRERTSDPLGPEFCVGHREMHGEA